MPKLSRRDYFAIHAPLTYEVIKEIYGGDIEIAQDRSRTAFFAIWALCAYEWADAMLDHRAILKEEGDAKG